jgi:YcxB-like protein
MKSTFIISESEMVAAMKVHAIENRLTRVILSICCIALVIAGALTELKILFWGVALAGLTGYAVVYFFATPFNAKKQFKENKLIKHEIDIEIEESGIRFSNNAGMSFINWSDFLKWKAGNGMYLLYITSNMFQMIPFRAISDLELFNEQLAKNIGPRNA